MQIVDGRAIAKKIYSEIKDEVAAMPDKPGLAIILIGDDPASKLYVRLKERACQKTGIKFEKHEYSDGADRKKIIDKINELNNRTDIHGIVLQLPLPPGFDEDELIKMIDPKKDVDGFHPENARHLLLGEQKIIPALAQSVMQLLKSTGQDLNDKQAVVIANSAVFYNFLAQLMQSEGIKSNYTKIDQSPQLAKTADIIIVAIGKPRRITADLVKPGSIIIDIGINQTPEGVIGDVDQKSLSLTDGFLTPVPGGVGPVTVAFLLKNTLQAAKQKTAA